MDGIPPGYAAAPDENRFGFGELLADLLWNLDPPPAPTGTPEPGIGPCVNPSDVCVGTVPRELSLLGPGGAGAGRDGRRGDGVVKSCAATVGDLNAEGACASPAEEGWRLTEGFGLEEAMPRDMSVDEL